MSATAASVYVVNVGYRGKDLLPPAKRGFGLLVPQDQNMEILGIIFDSCVFPTQHAASGGEGSPSETRLTVMIGTW